ncbi:MAG: STAS domain-containing protein [Ignavibacteriaceae bacterium]
MEDFEKKICADVIVEVINLTRATRKEAGKLKKILNEDILLKYRRIVVDISKCEFMDSTFLGALVVAHKKITQMGGEIKLVEPLDAMLVLLEKVGTLKIFDSYNTQREAIESFSFSIEHNNPHPLQI